jgi:tRNA (cytidine/uridine-2'-O-)-methyltransferase
MIHIVLYEPVIPQNTGSIARLCACTGSVLHLVHPLGFRIDEASVKRAGLDYWSHVQIRDYPNWENFLQQAQPNLLFFFSKLAQRTHVQPRYRLPAYLVFGNETKGLPDKLWQSYPDDFYTIPMRKDIVRSLNLAQCAAVVLYEVLRQNEFMGM